MKTTTLFKGGTILTLALFLITSIGQGQVISTLSGSYSSDLALTGTSGYYLLTSDVTIDSGATLTIDPGVSLKFDNTGVDLLIDGAIVANGNPGNQIYFYGEGFGGGSVAIRSGSQGASFNYCNFDSVGASTLSFFDCGLHIAEEGVTLSNCSFANNVISIQADANMVEGFTADNTFNQIRFFNNSLDDDATWPNPGSGVYELNGDLTVLAGTTLTIEPGVSVDFPSSSYDLVVDGNISAVGAVGLPITFYSEATFGGGSIALRDGSSSIFDRTVFTNMGASTLTFFDASIDVADVNTFLMSRTTMTGGLVDIRGRADALSGISQNNSISEIRVDGVSIAKSATLPNANGSTTLISLDGDLIVDSGIELEIQPGVNIQGRSTGHDILVSGTLTAEGTASMPIQFSTADSSFGTGSIVLLDGAVASLEYVEMDRWGASTLSAFDCAIQVDSATLLLENSTFTNTLAALKALPDALSTVAENNSLDLVRLRFESLKKDATWPKIDPSGFRYVVDGDQTVPAGITLTINPGTSIECNSTGHDLLVDGTLSAIGTAAEHITFTSINSFGGGSVNFRDGSTGTLDYVDFDSLNTSTLSAYDATVQILDATVNMSHTVFDNNRIDIKGEPTRLGLIDNTNSVETVQVFSGSIDENTTWPRMDTLGFVYQPLGDITVSAGNTWTLNPGIDIELTSTGIDLIIDGGRLKAEGNVYDSIRFFSDGANGGGSMRFISGFGISKLRYCTFDRLGASTLSAYDAGLEVLAAQLELFACSFIDAVDGIDAKSGSTLSILGCSFKNNDVGIDVNSGATITKVHRNHFSGNSTYGLYNDPANPPLFACDNWWGHPTGPFNAVNNPAALGDAVNDNVGIGPGCNLPVDPEVVCLTPENTAFLQTGPTSLLLAWDAVPGAFGYRVQGTKDDTLTGTFLTSINRRTIAVGLVPGDTITWVVKAGCVFDTSSNSPQNTAWLSAIRLGDFSDVEVTVWPNPTSETINIQAGKTPTGTTLTITDLSGKTMYQQQVAETADLQQISITVDKWSAGTYLYALRSNSGSATGKFVVN